MRRVFVCMVSCIGLAVLPGCGDSLAPHGALTGTWVASGGIYTVAMHLAQTGDSVTGGGSLHSHFAPPDMTFTVDGNLRQSTATLTFLYANGVTTQFTGRLVIPGFLAGRDIFSGGTSDSLTFRRE
jgi:hypothetical protein